MPRVQESVPFRYAVLSGANLAGAGCGFLVTLLIARSFGPQGLGYVSLALALLGYALEISTCGTSLRAVAQAAADHTSIPATIAAVITIRVVLSLAVYPVLIALSLAVPAFTEVDLLVAIYGLVLFANALNLVWVPQALHASHMYAANSVAMQSLTLLLVLACLGLGAGLWSVAASRALAEFVVAAALLLWAVRRVGRLRPPPDYGAVGRFALASAPFGGAQTLRSLAIGADPILLGLLVGAVELGYYASAYRIFMLLITLAAGYFVILLPRVAERAHDCNALSRELRQSLRYALPVVLAVAVALAVSADTALPLLFGSGFDAAAPALQLLGAALCTSVAAGHYRQVLLARGRGRTDLCLIAAATAVHLLSKLLLIPVIGITGAALGTLIGELFLAIALRRAALKELMRAGGNGKVAKAPGAKKRGP